MGDNTSADIKKIKERLFELGQLDIDDSVINELITSCHPFCNTDQIIELIIGTPVPNNTVCYKNSKTICANMEENHENSKNNDGKLESKLSSDVTASALNEAGGKTENVNKDTEKTLNNIQDQKTEYSNDNMLESSDYDSDDDNYYENLYADDNFDFLEDNNATHNSPSQPLAHLNLIEYTSSAHSVHKDSAMKNDRIDEVELLEENNNDPNNNLDSVQLESESSPELTFITKHSHGEVMIISDREDSPQPSCSKDINPQPSRIKLILRRETNQILNLLPRLNYGVVFKTLNKYQDANNRIECALREILLSEKPFPEVHKRKCVEDICTLQSKKCHSEEHHPSHIYKRKGKSKKRTGFNDAEDCILMTDNVDVKNKKRTNVMDMQSSEMKVKSEGTLSNIFKVTSPYEQNSPQNDNLIYHTADEGTPDRMSIKIGSKLVSKEPGNDITIPILKKKVINASVTNELTATAVSTTANLVKNNILTILGNGNSVSPTNEKGDTSCSQENSIFVNSEPENKGTPTEPNITDDIVNTAKVTEVCTAQNIVEDNANISLQKVKNDKIQKTIHKKEDKLTDPTSINGKDITDTAMPMEITINCTSTGSTNLERDVSLTVTSQDNKLIIPDGIDASIKSGILKPPKLIIQASVQSTTPISRSSSNILAPSKLVCTVSNMNTISSTHSSVTPILTPAKLINTSTNRDKCFVAKNNKSAVTVSNNRYLPQNVAKKVTDSCTSKHTIAEQNRDYVKPKDNTIEISGTSKAESNGNINSLQNKIHMYHLESTHNNTRSIVLHENQKEMCNKKCIKNKQTQNPTMLLAKSISQNVEIFETMHENMNTINNAMEIIAGPSTTGCISNKYLNSFPVTKLNGTESFSTINDPHNDETKESEKTNEPDTSIVKPAFVKYYYSILSMFPDVDPTYIKEECNKFISSSHVTVYEENEQFNRFVEHLLSTGSKHPRIHSILKENNEDQKNYDVKECYLDLLDFFPNADPNYLREKAERLYNNPEERKIFIQAKIDKPDYPTREEYIAKKQINEQQKQYTTNFSVIKFLEICPDPVSQFENRQRQCIFQQEAFEFLNDRFSQFRKDTLRRVYRSNNYNLSLTAKELDEAHPDRKTKRHIPQFLATENIPLLQEMAFITHKTELLEHIHKMNAEEAKEFKRLKERNELLQCQCCFDSEVMPSKCASCNEGHIFCHQCIQTGVETKLGDGETHIQCFLGCGNEFSISVLQSVLTPTKFSILLQKKQEAEVMAAGLEGLVSCPFCHFASIPPPEDKVFKCLNPECMKETCRLCKELNHIPLKCEEANAENVRHILEEKMTEALIRKCYKCKRPFFKEEGCNRMTCICGAMMCYICDKPIKNGYNHFSGQGSDRTDLCPLWSDNRRINAQTVAIAAEEAVKELRKTNPKLYLDARTLVPQVPQSSRGPHNDIPHSNVIPKRAYSVAKDNR